jgi:peptidoglycan/xylan/chitin deacetylase (PgdA/CDA1 family)
VVTFDDGWRDNYTNAWPILKEYDIPATIFLPTDFIGTGELFWFLKVGILFGKYRFTPEQVGQALSGTSAQGGVKEIDAHDFIEHVKQYEPVVVDRIIGELHVISGLGPLSELVPSPMLSWDEVREMNSDLIDFASHGQHHRILTLLSDNEVLAELAGSKAILEKELGEPTTLFSYPNGNYDKTTLALVKQAGYDAATITRPTQPVDPEFRMFALPRFGVHEGTALGINNRFSPAIFACYLEQMF